MAVVKAANWATKFYESLPKPPSEWARGDPMSFNLLPGRFAELNGSPRDFAEEAIAEFAQALIGGPMVQICQWREAVNKLGLGYDQGVVDALKAKLQELGCDGDKIGKLALNYEFPLTV